MREIRRRCALGRALWKASKGRRREVAVYRTYSIEDLVASGPLRSVGPRAVRVGAVLVPWSQIERVEMWPDVRCQNCLREHGPLQECLVGVIAGVMVDREDREIKPELLARVHVDEMWDRFGGPATDWLERHLEWLESQDAM